MTVPKRFGVLRFAGNLMKVIAWIFFIVAGLAAIGAIIGAIAGIPDMVNDYMGPLAASAAGTIGAIVLGVVVFIVGALEGLIFYILGEVIHMNLAVEENTRLTAALLLKMHQDGQSEAAPAYSSGSGSGGFANEPFES